MSPCCHVELDIKSLLFSSSTQLISTSVSDHRAENRHICLIRTLPTPERSALFSRRSQIHLQFRRPSFFLSQVRACVNHSWQIVTPSSPSTIIRKLTKKKRFCYSPLPTLCSRSKRWSISSTSRLIVRYTPSPPCRTQTGQCRLSSSHLSASRASLREAILTRSGPGSRVWEWQLGA